MKLLIGFSRRPSSIFSKLLQWYMKTDYSHCFVSYPNYPAYPVDIIFHSVFPSGTGIMSGEVFLAKNQTTRLYQIEVDPEVYAKIKLDLYAKAGTSYNMMQNVGVLIYDVAKMLGFRIRNQFTEDYNCSELIYRYVLGEAGSIGKEPNLITPRDVEEILKELQAMRIV